MYQCVYSHLKARKTWHLRRMKFRYSFTSNNFVKIITTVLIVLQTLLYWSRRKRFPMKCKNMQSTFFTLWNYTSSGILGIVTSVPFDRLRISFYNNCKWILDPFATQLNFIVTQINRCASYCTQRSIYDHLLQVVIDWAHQVSEAMSVRESKIQGIFGAIKRQGPIWLSLNYCHKYLISSFHALATTRGNTYIL